MVYSLLELRPLIEEHVLLIDWSDTLTERRLLYRRISAFLEVRVGGTI